MYQDEAERLSMDHGACIINGIWQLSRPAHLLLRLQQACDEVVWIRSKDTSIIIWASPSDGDRSSDSLSCGAQR